MNKSKRRQFLEADLARLDELLKNLPERRVVERIGFESRRRETLAELQKLELPSTAANVIVAFDGDPVAYAPGIDTKFAGEALVQFQDFVSIVDASKKAPVRETGPIPKKSGSALRLVGTVHGSFGFELQEVDNPMFATSLADSVKSATRLIAAAGQGDEEYIEAVSDSDTRVQTKLRDFLEVVRTAHAVCKVIADDTEAMLDKERVEDAVERVTTTKIVDVDGKRYSGTFGGLRLDSRDFNHEINDIGGFIKGKVHADVDRSTMTGWNQKWSGKPCVAVVIERTVSRLNKSTVTHTLKSLEPPGPGKDRG
jgi:hypothetical protein